MADDKKIIFDLQINAKQALDASIAITKRIEDLKKEQLELSKATDENGKAVGKNNAQYKAYQAQITSLTKEQRSLDNAVSQTIGALNFEAGSIAANRAELSKLTAEYKNIAKPTKEQTAQIKNLSDTLKEQESAIGNNTREVGNYGKALQGVAGDSSGLSNGIRTVTSGFSGFKQGIEGATAGFKGLRGAIIASGIGALALALSAVVSYFTSTNEGAKKLQQVMAGLGAFVAVVRDKFSEFGKIIVGVFENPKQALIDFGTSIKDYLLSRIELLVKGVSGLGKALGFLFEGEFKKAAKTASDAIGDIGLAVVPLDVVGKALGNLNDMFKGMTEQAYNAALAAAALEKRLQNLVTAERALSILNEKRRGQIEVLDKVSGDSARSDLERIEALNKASALQIALTDDAIKLAKERLSIIQQQNALSDSSEDDLQKEADAQIRLIQLVNERDNKIQDLKNKKSALIDALESKRQAAIKAELDALLLLDKAHDNLIKGRLQRELQVIDRELAATETSTKRKLELIDQRLQKQKEIEQASLMAIFEDEKIAQDDKINAQEQYIQTVIDLYQQKADAIAKINADAKKNQDKIDDEADKARRAKQNESIDTVNQYANLGSQALLVNNQNRLDQFSRQNEAFRDSELKAAGNNEAKKKKINEKYDKLNEKAQKDAARKAINVQIVQAIASGIAGFIKTLNSFPYPYSLIPAGIQAGTTALQVGSLVSQKSKLAKGGAVVGPSHANGGVTGTGKFGNIEVEGNEFVVNKRSYAMFPSLIEEINAIGNRGFMPSNKPNYMADGGIISSSSTTVKNQNEQASQMQYLLANLPPSIVRVSDINNVQGRVVRVKETANVTR